ncbi:MAG TPA: cytochrome c oxidase subunit II transmembrane domain-containing protein [Tepidisphaeraceae bacterium]|jgi:heme/copper-type cytochrome/quinol oxidase subunit 2|nr:cytochrome c oxidase subunit II transmembrane domain-containing protein [Tepidisphaeraceae bacterium]
MTFIRPKNFRRSIAFLTALFAVGIGARCAHAASAQFPLGIQWNQWWLNTNYAEHGKSADHIFYFIFWLTTIITVAVELVLVWFLFKYRRGDGKRRSIFSHGNTRLEMTWTLIPAIILIVVALWTKRAWDTYRYSPTANDPNAPKILVIGEQYQWNVLYGGPRNKIGRFLIFPKTTDLTWPTVPDGQSFAFPDVKGPAYMPEAEAQAVLNNYIASVNPLGRDYSDPDTNPDPDGTNPALASLNDRNNALSRFVILPKERPVEIDLGSKDVIHDFFLPNFRTRLDVVPGMKGRLYVTATADCPGPRFYTLAELETLVKNHQDMVAIVNKAAGGEFWRPAPRKPRMWRIADPVKGGTLVMNGAFITLDMIQEAREAKIPSIFATCAYDLVCEELCGLGHAKMQGHVIVLDDATLSEPPYDIYFPKREKPGGAALAVSQAH